MIANPNWFSPRKYSGWGLTPNCWQGWLYIVIIVLPLLILNKLSLPSTWSTVLTTVWALVFFLDFVHIFMNIKKDERDIAHEAIAERNAMWFIITALALGVIYQSSISIAKNNYQIDPIILIALVGATVVKAITNLYLRRK